MKALSSRQLLWNWRGRTLCWLEMPVSKEIREWGWQSNSYFSVIGNLIADPRASIQFLDFKTGSSLQLSGQCQVLWDEVDLPGAQRTMEFVTQKWVHIREALPFKQSAAKVKWSPYNPLPTSQYFAGSDKVLCSSLKAGVNANKQAQSSPLMPTASLGLDTASLKTGTNSKQEQLFASSLAEWHSIWPAFQTFCSTDTELVDPDQSFDP